MNVTSPSRRVVMCLGILVVVAAVVRFWGLDFGLPHTQARPDETHIIEASRTMLSGRLPRLYDYPWLYVGLLSVLYLGYYVWGAVAGTFGSVADMVASWPMHWEPFFLLSRAAAATFGTATVLVVFRMARRLHGDAAGLIAAGFLALAFIHARDSHFGTTDTALTFFIVLSVDMLIAADGAGSQRRFMAAGIVGGLGAATKYNAVLLIAPIVVSYLQHVWVSRDRVSALRDPRLFSYGVPFLLAFGIGIPFVVFDNANFMAAMADLQRSMARGDPRLDLANGWVHHLQFSLRYGVGLPLLLAGVGGLLLAILQRQSWALVLASFPVFYYVVAGSLRNLYFRYMIPVVPFLCIGAAFLVVQLAGALTRRTQEARRESLTRLAILVLAAAIIAPSALAIGRFDLIVNRPDSRVLLAQWFAAHVPAGSSLLQSGSRYGLAQFPREMRYVEWTWDGASGRFKIAGRPAEGEPDWIVVQDSPLPSSTQPLVTELLRRDYQLVTTVRALAIRDDMVYDRMDMFYMPFSGLEHVDNPGPNFAVYARSAVPFTTHP